MAVAAGVAARSCTKASGLASTNLLQPLGLAKERCPLASLALNTTAQPRRERPKQGNTVVRAELEAAPPRSKENGLSSVRSSLEARVLESSTNGATQSKDVDQEGGSILDGVEEDLPRQRRDRGLVMEAFAASIPHPDKIAKGGEDAYFVSDSWGGAIGVADGVGGWADEGVDPALYSKELVRHAARALTRPEFDGDIQAVLNYAATSTRSEGAATVCMARLGPDRILRIANLGDSGLRVLRQGQVVFGTPSQQHYFDCPYQLGPESTDSPKDAQVYEVLLEEGDVLVMGSDGLFDNIFDRDIEAIVRLFSGSDYVKASERCACALAALAKRHSRDREYASPYILEAIQVGHDVPLWEKLRGKKLSGGKLDDITVVVAHITEGTPKPTGKPIQVDIGAANGQMLKERAIESCSIVG